jgi:hypothetical protein
MIKWIKNLFAPRKWVVEIEPVTGGPTLVLIVTEEEMKQLKLAYTKRLRVVLSEETELYESDAV